MAKQPTAADFSTPSRKIVRLLVISALSRWMRPSAVTTAHLQLCMSPPKKRLVSSVAEALARNLKFFGFDVGGIPEIALAVDGAELLPAGDWNGLENSIRRWIDAGSPQPTSAADVMRERYHPPVIARRHLEIYREVLAAS